MAVGGVDEGSGVIAVPGGAVPPLTAARMAARYAALEARANQGVIGRMDNARKIFQREEHRCLKENALDELDALRRSAFVHNPARRAAGCGSAYAAGWGFYLPDGGGHRFPPRQVLDTPERTPRQSEGAPPAPTLPAGPATAAAAVAPRAGPPPRTADAATRRGRHSSNGALAPAASPTPPATAPPPQRSRAESRPAAGGGRLASSASTSALPPPRQSTPTGARAAPFATAYNSAPPVPQRAALTRGGSVGIIRRARGGPHSSGERYVKELSADLGGLAVPGGRWGWAGPELHTRALWGSRAAQAPARSWNSWQPAERDGTLLIS